MNKLVIHFGAGNIGRGLIGQLSQLNDLKLVFVDLNKDLIDQINSKKQYTIRSLQSDQNVVITNCSGLVLGVDNDKIIEMISQAGMITTSIGSQNLSRLVELIQKGLKLRSNLDKISLACFENAYKASQNLYEEIVKDDYLIKDKLTYINVVVDRLVPTQKDPTLDLIVEDFFSVWYVKEFRDSTWLFNKKTGEILTNYDNYFYQKFYGVNGLHFSVALLGWKHKKLYINEVLDDRLLKYTIAHLVEELSLGISKYLDLDLNETKVYLEKNIERFSNKYLTDQIERVCRNISQKLGKNERFLPIYEYLIEHNYKHEILDEIYKIAKEYMNR